MGRIGRILSYVFGKAGDDNIADIKSDIGGGDNRTAQHFQPANSVSQPLPSDIVVMVQVPGQGKMAAVGFVDPAAPQDIAAGEHKTYSRDSAGAVKASVTIKADGSVLITNDAGGSINLQSDGIVNINGATIDMSGAIESPTSITAPSAIINGKELAEHTHTQDDDSGGNTEQNTGPNI